MPKANSFQDLFLDEARELYSAEAQLIQALPRLAEAATSDEIRAIIESHFEETRTHIQRLDEAFELLDETPGGRHCADMAGILVEGTTPLDEEDDCWALDDRIVTTAQRAAHYEIAAYGSLIASATTLGAEEIADILRRTLEEEKAAEAMLLSLAEERLTAGTAGSRRGVTDHPTPAGPLSA
jgi:ferritin-like metal-binding protein YciE